jgi:hypothetical protein
VDDLTRRRLKHNEAVFRNVNDEIDEMGAGGSRSTLALVCECADPSCKATLRLSHAEYERIRSEPKHYILVPGHDVPEIEDVVEQSLDHIVVEKN